MIQVFKNLTSAVIFSDLYTQKSFFLNFSTFSQGFNFFFYFYQFYFVLLNNFTYLFI